MAFRSPVAMAECANLIRGSLADGQIMQAAGGDPFQATALCVLAANSGIGVGVGDDGGLSHVLQTLQPDVRMSVALKLSEWPGPVAQSARACWLAFLQGQALPAFAPDQMQAPVSLTPAHQQALGMGGLRKVLSTAPPELCCALDRQVLTDPLRSPYGHAFEYTVLAWTLVQNGGSCPITGQPLTLESCRRDEELQQQAASWIQTQYG